MRLLEEILLGVFNGWATVGFAHVLHKTSHGVRLAWLFLHIFMYLGKDFFLAPWGALICSNVAFSAFKIGALSIFPLPSPHLR